MSDFSKPEAASLKAVSDAVLDAAYHASVDYGLARLAEQLDDAFGDDAKRVTVTEDSLRACLKQKDRNKAKLEWAPRLVTLPGGESMLTVLADHAGYSLVKRTAISAEQFRETVLRELPRQCGYLGGEFLKRLQGLVHSGITAEQFRDAVVRELPAALGHAGEDFLARLEGRVSK